MAVLIVGSVALDDIRTPYGEKRDILGGSASHSATITSYFTRTAIVGIIGDDFPKKYLRYFQRKGIDTQGLRVVEGGKTFHWSGRYEDDMNQAHTLETRLNVFEQFSPRIPAELRDFPFVLLGNITPELQLDVLDQMRRPKLTLLDTMNFWIQGKFDELLKVFRRVSVVCINDAEARMLTGQPNLLRAAREIRKMGPKGVIIKKGEHGAMLFTERDVFVTAAFPLWSVNDPTGAGDSFAGGFLGYLAQQKSLSRGALRGAMTLGTVMASFCCEGFGVERSARLTPAEIRRRLRQLRAFSQTGKLSVKF